MISPHTTRAERPHLVCHSIARPDARALAQYHLGRLLAALEQLRQNGAEGPDTDQVACWTDEEYHYVEVSQLDPPAPAFDLNVHEGIAFFRVER